MHVAIVFIASLISAAAWAKYVPAAVNKRAWAATFWDGAIYFFGNVLLLGVWHDSGSGWLILVSALAGSMAGTYVAVKWL